MRAAVVLAVAGVLGIAAGGCVAAPGQEKEVFEPTGKYVVTGNDSGVDSFVYENPRTGALLVPAGSACVHLRGLRLRVGRLYEIPCEDLARHFEERRGGHIIVTGRSRDRKLVIRSGGRTWKLAFREPMLGLLSADALRSTFPEYERAYRAYVPFADDIATIAATSGMWSIRVYLGTWCGICARIVPRVMKTADLLGSEHVRVEYYGIGPPVPSDPIAREVGAEAVPLVIVEPPGGEEHRFYYRQIADPAATFAGLAAPRPPD